MLNILVHLWLVLLHRVKVIEQARILHVSCLLSLFLRSFWAALVLFDHVVALEALRLRVDQRARHDFTLALIGALLEQLIFAQQVPRLRVGGCLRCFGDETRRGAPPIIARASGHFVKFLVSLH